MRLLLEVRVSNSTEKLHYGFHEPEEALSVLGPFRSSGDFRCEVWLESALHGRH